MDSLIERSQRDPRFTFHVGRMCGGGYGFLLRWFGSSDTERFRIGWSSR